ncbi:hypothetical protein Q1695_004229 [Nippostrongylus brasiliensis]|nr:hypothetical protein Q1695_004229 [Nippostrongylus brasiliensis]
MLICMVIKQHYVSVYKSENDVDDEFKFTALNIQQTNGRVAQGDEETLRTCLYAAKMDEDELLQLHPLHPIFAPGCPKAFALQAAWNWGLFDDLLRLS